MSPSAPAPEGESVTGWTDVVKKKKSNQPEQSVVPEAVKVMKKTSRLAKPPRTRPPTVIIAKDDEQFPELLKTMRSKINPEANGNAISRICMTQKGDLLLEINGEAEAAELVRKEVVWSLGPKVRVRKIKDTATIEIRDLDGVTTDKEIMGDWHLWKNCGVTGQSPKGVRGYPDGSCSPIIRGEGG